MHEMTMEMDVAKPCVREARAWQACECVSLRRCVAP